MRCKFRCDSVTLLTGSRAISLIPVKGNGSDENKAFAKDLPGGKLELQTINREIDFQPDREYFVDISETKGPKS